MPPAKAVWRTFRREAKDGSYRAAGTESKHRMLQKRSKTKAKIKRLKAKLREQEGRSRRQGYLHIPKTGGTGIQIFLRRISKEADESLVPTKFNHFWTAKKILKRYPEMKLHFTIRDPVERTISGFLSRLRMGRPRNENAWSLAEAAAFAYFDRPEDMLRGLLSNDEKTKSSAIFCLERISHLRLGYSYYFKSPEAVRSMSPSFGVIQKIERSEYFLRDLCRECGLPEEKVDEFYKIKHTSATSTRAIKESLTQEELKGIEKALDAEYEIYRYLETLCRPSG